MNQKVSVIVPVYNAENYLEECIQSILQQTYPNIELVLVNDGSRDHSHEICEKYAQDGRAVYVNKENGGASSARNAGLKQATGDYVMFVDADDFIEETMVDDMYKALKGSDSQVVCCGFKKFYDNEHSIDYAVVDVNGKNPTETHQIIFNELIGGRGCGSPVCKMYCHTILQKENILFDEKISNNEDVLFNLEYFKTISRAVVLDIHPYNYRKGQESLSSGYMKNWKALHLKIYEAKKRILGKELCAEKSLLLQHGWFLLNLIGVINELLFGSKTLAKQDRKENLDLYLNNILSIKNRRKVIYDAYNYPDRRANFRRVYPLFAYCPVWLIKLVCHTILTLK